MSSRQLSQLPSFLHPDAPSSRTAQQPLDRVELRPELSGVQGYAGDLDFGLNLRCALAGAPAALLISPLDGVVALNGLTLNATPVVSTVLLATSPTGGARFPLPIPNDPALIGPSLFVQALVLDAGAPLGLAASRGLRVVASRAPGIFVASTRTQFGGSRGQFHLFDRSSSAIIDTGLPDEVQFVEGLTFDPSGERVFLLNAAGQAVLGDLSSVPVSWSVLASVGPSGISPFAVSSTSIHLDARRQLLWVYSASRFSAVDVDPFSSSFGQIKYRTADMGLRDVLDWDLSPSGDVIAAVADSLLFVIDTDPVSPMFGQDLFADVLVVPDVRDLPTLGFRQSVRVAVRPNDRDVLVAIGQPQHAEVARFDLGTGMWIDQNGAAAGRNIGGLAVPRLFLGGGVANIQYLSDGSGAVLTGGDIDRFNFLSNAYACGWAGRLEFDPKDPTVFTWHEFSPGVPFPGAFEGVLSRDETEIGIPTWFVSTRCGQTQEPQIVRIDVKTGAFLGAVSVPPFTPPFETSTDLTAGYR